MASAGSQFAQGQLQHTTMQSPVARRRPVAHCQQDGAALGRSRDVTERPSADLDWAAGQLTPLRAAEDGEGERAPQWSGRKGGVRNWWGVVVHLAVVVVIRVVVPGD